MASRKIAVDDETTEQMDEVTDIKIQSNDDDDGNGILPGHCSEMLDKDIDEEIELFLKQDCRSDQDVAEDKVELTRNSSELRSSVTDTGRENMACLVSDCSETDEVVHDSLEIKRCMQTEKKGPEKQNDQTVTFHNKRVHNNDGDGEKEIDCGLGVVESDANCLENMEHSDELPGSETGSKTDQNICVVKAKNFDVEAKSTETTSVRTYLISRDLSPLWDSYILAVKGIPPKESGKLKQVLNDVLGNNCHRVRPRQKGDTIVHLHFITQEDMRIAKETLITQGVANYKLTVTVESAEGQKSVPEDGSEGPVSKKMKHHHVLQFYEEAYEKQIEFKVKDITSRLQDLEKDILIMYPTYSGLINQRRLQHNGVICAVEKLKDCPASERLASTCWFAIGVNEETGQLALGVFQGNGNVRKLSSVKHNYPDHVVKAAEVFEEFLLAEENRKICRKLLICTNRVKDLMLLVFVHDTSHVKQVGDDMKVFFTSGDGAKCHVTSIHIKVMKSNHDIKDGAMQLVFGVPCLQETVSGVKLQLPPLKNLWNTVHGAEMLCQIVEELLVPSKEVTLLDIGCGVGLLGLYLSKMAGEVLGVDTDCAVAVATKNASLNGIRSCRYFAGDAEVMIPVLAKKRKYGSVCAVVTCCINNSHRSGRAMEELRKIQHLDRLVLIEDRTMSSSAILSLIKPSSDKNMGNPFFPLKVVPVDSLPNSKGYVLVVLLGRVDGDDIKKFGIDDNPVPADSELNPKGGASRRPYERGSKLRLRQGDRYLLPNTPWERGAFSQQRYDTGAGAVQKSLLQNTRTLSGSHRQFEAADILSACVGTGNDLTNVANEYEVRRQMEDYRRQMIDEEHRLWLAEKEQRKVMEEMQLRQIQKEEWNRHMHDEWMRWAHEEQVRRIQEEEHKKIQEWEWRIQVQEEMEEQRMRRIEEEEYRKIQEAEWRRGVQEVQWRKCVWEEQRQMEEDDWRRRIQEHEQRKQTKKEQQRRTEEQELRRKIQEGQRSIEEDKWRRQMERENQKRSLLVETCSGQVGEELRRERKERKRGLVRASNIRSRNDLMQDLIAESLRAAAVPQLSVDVAQKVKHLVAEAIRTVGAMDQGERHGVGRSREAGGVYPDDNTVSRFGTSDKEMSQSRHMEEEYLRYIREVESGYDHSHDMGGGALGRYSSEQNDLKPHHQAVSTKSNEKLPSLLELKLRRPELSPENSYSAQHSEDRGFCLGIDTNQWQGRVLTAQKEFGNDAELDRLADFGKQARDIARRDEKSTFSSVTEETADIYMRRSDLDQGKLRGTIRRDRTDVWGNSSRNQTSRPEHGGQDFYCTSPARLSTRPWMNAN